MFTKFFSHHGGKLAAAVMIVILLLTVLPVSRVLAATAGPNDAATGADVSGVGTATWNNTAYVVSNNNQYATVAVNNAASHYLRATGYGFAIPGNATIDGITVVIGRYGTTNFGSDVRDNVVRLVKNNVITGNNLAATGTDWPGSEAAATYGGAANLWGTTWTPAEINDTNFGVALSVTSSNNRTAYVDYIQITVTYTVPTTTIGDGTSPSSKAVGGSAVNNAVSEFTLSTNTGTDTVTSLTVTGGGTGLTNVAASGVKIYLDGGATANEWDAGDTLIATASFSGVTATFNALNIAVTTTSARYIVTYDIVASPVVNQTMTGYISAAVTATNPVTNNDNTDATLTTGYVITASAGTGGTIAPSGGVAVASGSNQSFDIAPNNPAPPATSFIVSNVELDNATSIGRANNYTFTNVTANHTIIATFNGGWSYPSGNANGGGGSWNNSANGYTSNNQRSTSPFFGGSVDYFNFNIPAIPAGSTIDGVEVAVEGYTTTSNVSVSISPNGAAGFTTATNISTAFTANANESTDVLGSPDDLSVWGNIASWSPSSFTNANFRLRIASVAFAGFSLDQVQVKVHYREPTTLAVDTATGNYGGTVTLTGTLTTTLGGNPISGQTVNFYLNGVSAGSAVTNASGVATLNNASLAGINVGTYAGTYNTSGVGADFAGTMAGDLPGYLGSTAANTLTVNKAQLTVTANNKTRTYGAANPVLDAAITGFVNGEDLNSSDVTGDPVCTTTATSSSPVGTYPITCVIGTLASNNYSFTFAAGTLTIDPADLLITASNGFMVYGGTVSVITPIYSGLQAGDAQPAVPPTCSTTATSASPVGAYPSTCSGAADPNYTITYAAGTVNVTPAVLTVTANDKTRAYGDANPPFDATITGFVNGEDLLTSGITGSPDCTTTATSTSPVSGSPYTITCTAGTLAASNYSFVFVDGQLTITSVTLTVTANNKTRAYGEPNPAFDAAITGFVNGENLLTSDVTGAPDCTTSATPASPVSGNPYPITCTAGTLSSANYNFTFVSGQLTITTAALTVTANDKSRAYGAANPLFDATITGFVNGEDLNTSDVTGAPNCATTATQTSPAGTYPITCTVGTLISSNYSFTFAPGTLTVVQVTLTVTANDKNREYGLANPTLDATITGFVNGEDLNTSDVTGAPDCTTIAVPSSPVGSYPITCTIGTLASNNYGFTFTDGTLQVTKAALVVTASSHSLSYGDAVPPITPSYSGLRAGDLAPATPPTCSTTATSASPVGAYPSTCFGAADPNYTISYMNGVVTIGTNALLITASDETMVYGGTVPVITPIYSGLQAGDTQPAVPPTCSTTATSASPVGAYPSTCSGAADPNYTITYAAGTVDVTQAALNITASSETMIYGDIVPAITPSYTGFVAGDTPASLTTAPTCSTTAAGTSFVGSYPSTCSGAVSLNYSITYTDGTVTVNKRPITVTALTDTKAYDGNTSSLGIPNITLGTLVNGDTANFIQTFDTPEVDTGKTLTPSGSVNDGNGGNNYDVTFVQDNTGSIVGITVTVAQITADDKIYDGTTVAALNTGSAVLIGVVPGDDVNLDVSGAAGNFINKNVGNGKTVYITGLTLTGADAANYGIIPPTTIADITTRPITVTAQTNTKVYDSATSSAAVPSITVGTLAGGDTSNFTQSYNTPNVGTSKILTPSGAVNDGNGGGNYLVTFENNTTGVITARPLTITADPKSKAFGDPDPFFTYSITNGSLAGADSLSGNLTRVPGEAVGAYAILQGSLTAGSNYAITYVGANLTITIVNQTITVVTPAPAGAAYNTSFNVAATASSGLPVAITTTGSCTGGGSSTATIIIVSGTGTCTVHYNQAGDANYSAAIEVIETTVAQKADQVITVNTAAPANAAFNTGFNVAAIASSGLPVAYSATGVCSNAGSNFTMTSGTGACTVHFNQAGDVNYNAAAEVTETVNAQKANQTISVTVSAPANAVYNSNFTVAATASSGLTVAYTSGGSCTNVGATYTMTGSSGTCSVFYNQAGDANYNAAPQITQTVTAQKANQTITVIQSAPASAANGSNFTVIATASSGLPVAITTSGFCTGGGSGSAVITMTSGTGSCTVNYDQAGNANYNAAPQVNETVNSTKANQTISVITSAPATAINDATFSVAASASSGLPVAVTTSGVCTGGGTGTVIITMISSSGTCTVHYDQAGNTNYNAAPQVNETTNAVKANQTITINTNAPATAANGSDFTVAATASSGLSVTYSATGSCTNSGATFTMTSGAGTCTVHYNQAGNADYNAAVELTEGVTALKGSQTITVTTHAPVSAANGSSFNVAALASSGLPVAITATGVCSGGGSGSASITVNASSGTCMVHYNQAGDANNWNAAPEVTENTSALPSAQAITVTTHAPASSSMGSSFDVAANSNSGLTVSITVSGGVCSVVDHGDGTATVTVINTTGACAVHYNQAGDANYAAAPEVIESVSLDSTAPTVTINQAATQADPTNSSPINFTVVFSEPITGFTDADVIVGGTAGASTVAVTEIAPNNGTTYNAAVAGMTVDGTVSVSIPAGAAKDVSNNDSFASSSTDNVVTYFDGAGPSVAVDGVNTSPDTGDSILRESEVVTVGVTQFTVKFTQDVYNPVGDSALEDVTNPNNYMLVRDLGDIAGFQTVSCAAGAVTPADTNIAINNVTYDSAAYIATFTVNSSLPLSNGSYRLYVCGSTSIVDPLDTSLKLFGNNGPATDFTRNFSMNIANNGGGNNGGNGDGGNNPRNVSGYGIPVTGFAPGKVTRLPQQPANLAYSNLNGVRLEIPVLSVNVPIVGVNLTPKGWNLTWLENNAGYLEGSAYPTWAGNTVLTGHVIDASNAPGPFAYIKDLQVGDRVMIHMDGYVYIYEVQENREYLPTNISAVFQHEEYNWVTLVTCEDYNPMRQSYNYRRVVRAVLISIIPE